MATTRYPNTNDLRRQVGSPRSKGRENKDTLCRNILIYGNCRYEDQGCTFKHSDPNKTPSQPDFASNLAKKAFNVESPSFTPAPQQAASKKSTFSSQAASAAPFTPRGVGGPPNPQQNTETAQFNPAAIREFTPQSYDAGNGNASGSGQDNGIYPDPFAMGSMSQTLPTAQFNPYAGADPTTLPGSNAAFFSQQFSSGPLPPPNYHLYQPVDSFRIDLQPWQRTTYDFFIPAKMREEMQKKMFATQQIMPNSGLPQLERWHSLFPLDTNNRKNTTSFSYPSWMYKAKHITKDRYYALRRLEGYRLTNENAILKVMKEWKKIKNGSIVTVHEIFTTREFGDSSLIFVYDWHPLAKTLQEHYFHVTPGTRYRPTAIPEATLWGYICQITNALKAIHSAGLAARCLELSKIILTDKNRIRLAACSILDVVNFETDKRTLEELQQDDLVKFGKVVLSLATNNQVFHPGSIAAALESLGTRFTTNFKEAVTWLISPPSAGESKSIDNFIGGVATQMTTFFDLSLQERDEVHCHFGRELENGRIARILMKLATINERGDFAGVRDWSENGDRYILKLFRDYVFHQVEADGRPALGVGHMLSCMNKLDAGTDEMVMLTSADNETVFVLSYRELKKMFDRAFNELVKQSKEGAPGSI